MPMRNRFDRRAATAVLTAGVLAAAGLAAAVTPAAAVHGGRNTTVKAHPYAMLIETSDGRQVCGGTLVAPAKVLTAAHCVADADAALALRVVGGRTSLAGTEGTVRGIASVRLHPKFEQARLTYDAAVLELSAPMRYAPLPVAGSRDSALYTLGKKAKAVGWGRTARDTPATRLKSAVLVLAPLKTCEPFTEPTDSRALKVCGAPTAGTYDSICRGDSGGPLVAGGKVIGIVSTGNKYCDNDHPDSVFTRTSAVAGALGLPVS
ncbi:S1 family peptidase [Streptomyces sp. NPDC020141]|uniref:S1 family peptidase n=1 Tax=Streptomyces sp. NPDC020141 TaxID=3365065 RepID=UPI0037877AB8